MIVAFRVAGEKVDLIKSKVDEWNVINESSIKKFVSPQRFFYFAKDIFLFKYNPLLSLQMLFYILWCFLFIPSLVFGWLKIALISGVLFLLIYLMFSPKIYLAGIKSRLKKEGIVSSVTLLSGESVLECIVDEVNDGGV